jgi:hypothetical protein
MTQRVKERPRRCELGPAGHSRRRGGARPGCRSRPGHEAFLQWHVDFAGANREIAYFDALEHPHSCG